MVVMLNILDTVSGNWCLLLP